MADLVTMLPSPGPRFKGRDVERAVDGAIERYVSEVERQHGPDDEFVTFMRSMQRTAAVLPFLRSPERSCYG
jgi:hypothetical protein